MQLVSGQVVVRRPAFVTLEIFPGEKVFDTGLHHGDVRLEATSELSDHLTNEVGMAEGLALSVDRYS